MKNESAVLYGIIGFLGGIVLTVFFASDAVNNNNTPMMQMMGIRQRQSVIAEKQNKESGRGMGMSSSMDEMMDSMKDEEGENFDKAFIEAMIPHHQGAIEMAKSAQKNAKHEELKKLANDIIIAQTEEINLMQSWLKAWGY